MSASRSAPTFWPQTTVWSPLGRTAREHLARVRTTRSFAVAFVRLCTRGRNVLCFLSAVGFAMDVLTLSGPVSHPRRGVCRDAAEPAASADSLRSAALAAQLW